MKIVLVQPTDLSPKHLKRDFWDIVDSDLWGLYNTFAEYERYYCEYIMFESFKEAKGYVSGLSAPSHYKRMMIGRLNYLKNDAKTFNWAVA